jgi:hypothetical protein
MLPKSPIRNNRTMAGAINCCYFSKPCRPTLRTPVATDLRESGFIKVEVKGKSGDGGIDGIGMLRINLLSFQVFFQCKRYKDNVGAGAIRDFRARW